MRIDDDPGPLGGQHHRGGHRLRIPDRVIFDKLVQILVLGAVYKKIAEATYSVTTLRDRRDEWTSAGVFTALEQLCLQAYDRIVGLQLADLVEDGCIVKASVVARPPADPRWTAANAAPNAPCWWTRPASRSAA